MLSTYSTNEFSRPDRLLIPVIYFILWIIIGAGSAFIMFTIPLAESIRMTREDSLFLTGTVAIVIIALFALAAAIIAGYCVLALWQGRTKGRSISLIFAGLILVMSIGAMPVMLIEVQEPIVIYSCIFFIAGSLAVIHTLMHPEAKRYFGRKENVELKY